jgi:serine protease Do
MKKILTSKITHLIFLSIALGGLSGIFATAMTNSYLSDYALQLNEQTLPLGLEKNGPKAFPDSYAEATKRFTDISLKSVVSLFPKSSKTAYGFTQEASIATGVIVTSDGWIAVPSLPLVAAEAISVQIKDQVYEVTRMVTDPLTQVVFLKCTATNLPVVGFGGGLDLSIGDQLFVASRADQLSLTSVVEQMWQRGMILSSDVPSRRVLLSSPLVGANAPVFNLSGAFVGFALKKDAQTILLPFEDVTPSLYSLLEKKEITHPSFGVSYLDLTHSIGLEDSLRRGHQTGAYVTGRPAVKKGSPAALSGIKEGDIILAWNGEDINQTRSLNEYVLTARAGDKVSVTIDRAGETKKIDVVLGEYIK